MKYLLKIILFFLLPVVMLSCSKNDDPGNKPTPITLTDLLDQVIVSEYPDGYLELYVFNLDQNNEARASIIRKDYEATIPFVLENNVITLSGGELKFLLSKDADGKLVLDEFINSFPPKRTVMFIAADALPFVGKTYIENSTSYIGFSATHWGWSMTPTIQHTTEYNKGKGYSYWESISTQLYLGVNIPVGVQWDGQAGPLMLVDRTGFTKPSIYKPL